MPIDRIVLHRVCVPMHEPFRISNGIVDAKEAVVVEVREDGLTGYGEASPMAGSFYSAQTPESTWLALCSDLVPSLLAVRANDFAGRLSVLADCESAESEPFALAGIENALWDLEARKRGKPLWALLGGSDRPVASGLAVGLYDSIPTLIERIRAFLACGYQRIKIKICPGWDIEPIETVRCEFPNFPLMVDANASYGPADLGLIRELDRFGLMMIEQPFAREELGLSAEAQKAVRTPICADESADSLDAVRRIIVLGAARIINIKIQRVGGLHRARAIHDLAASVGMPCWVGTMPELGIASAHGLHLATLPNFSLPTDIEASSRWYTDEIVRPRIEVCSDGCIRLPAGQGIGYAPDFHRFVLEGAAF